VKREGYKAAAGFVCFYFSSLFLMSGVSRSFVCTTYNILSSHLAGADHFPRCNAKDLKRRNRFPRILAHLEDSITQNAIISLQEVPRMWSGPLHAFFQEKGYVMIDSLYGRFFNGYMGVAIAYNPQVFALQDCKIFSVADSIKDKREKPLTTFIGSWVNWVSSFLPGQKEPPVDPWNKSRDRKNTSIFCRFRLKEDPEAPAFCVATYHMPCAFWCPPIMTIHVTELMKQTQRLANGDRLVVNGDFNFMPDSPMYKLVTTGQMDRSDAAYPPPNGNWTMEFKVMKSSYAVVLGKEPETTNFPGIESEFTGTLDYIFYSEGLKARKCLPLPAERELEFMPSATQPSDHLLLQTTFDLQ